MYTIINEETYIKVTFNGGVSFSAILEAFLRIAALPGYEHKNRIWIFRQNDEASLPLSTISSVIPIIGELDKPGKKKNKVAIVLQNGNHSAITGLFSDEEKTGSRSIDLFENLDSAVQWVAA
ncbi:hypothetical protein BIU88_05385 [Chlorobaculum limnaeum]|jgi:hypothetical protein|uniref:STAS/SEC14 domain-containing protein n=1 Tax=Chlorobaculum limnaeum TaxID=274537 RepID=A0A1D8CXH5_CHLLM|nr:hypothetical protein [Chlorobaculum limnaeum]AOS83630.1 hypothetical protein BIU88_05385 [Chlorobaculum limnaeum]